MASTSQLMRELEQVRAHARFRSAPALTRSQLERYFEDAGAGQSPSERADPREREARIQALLLEAG